MAIKNHPFIYNFNLRVITRAARRNVFQRLMTILLAVSVSLQTGCADMNIQKEFKQYKLGDVVVTTKSQEQEVAISGKAESAAVAFGSEAMSCFTVTFGCMEFLRETSFFMLICAIPLSFSVVCTAIGGTSSAASAAYSAPDGQEIQNVKEQSTTNGLQQLLLDTLVAAARANGKELKTVQLDIPDQLSGLLEYHGWSGTGADTIIEVKLSEIRLEGYGRETPLGLYMRAHVRIFHPKKIIGNPVSFETDYIYHGEKQTLSYWSANHNEHLLQGVRAGTEHLGQNIYTRILHGRH